MISVLESVKPEWH